MTWKPSTGGGELESDLNSAVGVSGIFWGGDLLTCPAGFQNRVATSSLSQFYCSQWYSANKPPVRLTYRQIRSRGSVLERGEDQKSGMWP